MAEPPTTEPTLALLPALEAGRLRLSEAAALLWAVAPTALGGVCLRSRPGAARERWIGWARAAWSAAAGADKRRPTSDDPVWRRLPPGVGEDRLLGALDVAGSLAAGRCVQQPGLLEQSAGGVLLVPMAERLSANTAAHLGRALDAGHGPTVLAFDESEAAVEGQGEGSGETVPLGLADRLVLRLDLDREALAERIDAAGSDAPAGRSLCAAQGLAAAAVAAQRWPEVVCKDDALAEWAALAQAFGVSSLRALQGGLPLARASAALAGRRSIETDDWQVALRLVLLPRATQWPAAGDGAREDVEDDGLDADGDDTPAPENLEPPPSTPPPAQPEAGADAPDTADPSPPPLPSAEDCERIVAAAMARLPPDLLAGLQARLALAGRLAQPSGRAGQRMAQGARGAAQGARRGDPRRGARLALVDTLRAAAPWQRLRRRGRDAQVATAAAAQAAPRNRLIVLPGDLHVRRHRPRAATVALFVVDASGSAAVQRMAEAKGAVERLLADCYARRDQVGLMAFGGRLAGSDPSLNPGVQVLLPPTRSLVRAKRCLAGLPGGGGTPLAAALAAAGRQAAQIRSGGASPLLVLLTDGRANLGHRGEPLARPEALALAVGSARQIAAAGLPTLLIDIAPRPSPAAQTLAEALRGRYLPLPAMAASAAVADAVRSVRAQGLPQSGAGSGP